jgi:hypothetical protein
MPLKNGWLVLHTLSLSHLFHITGIAAERALGNDWSEYNTDK